MSSPLTQVMARILFAPILMVAAAILVKGYASTGDGFSAGAVAAIGVLIQYLAFEKPVMRWLVPVRFLWGSVFGGLFLVLAVTFVPVLVSEPPMSHVPPAGGRVIYLGTLELHTAVLFDIGIFFVVFGFSLAKIHAILRAEGRRRKS